jgi:NAD dependent epimerase/dehydratase family enzyme
MKVVFTGSSGYIGSQVFKQTIADERIHSIVSLVRRQPANSWIQHSKVETIIVKDFNNFDEETITEIDDADAAIWCAGTFTGDQVGLTLLLEAGRAWSSRY